MSSYNNFELLGSSRTTKPFKDLWGIHWRADRVLKNRASGQWRVAAHALDGWISEWVECRIEEATEEYIGRLSSEGGWELGYLPRDRLQSSAPVTSGEIRYLLENWPSEADDQPDFPSEDDFSDLEALSDILSSGYPRDDIEGFPLAQKAELFAVLALMKVNAAAALLFVPTETTDSGYLLQPGLKKLRTEVLIAAGSLAVKAMDIICYAERELSDAELAKMRREQKVQIEAQIRSGIRLENAKQGARAKLAHDPRQRDKLKVYGFWEDWQKRPIRYASKAEFARDMLERFKSLKSQPVIEQWCRDWKAASISKQAQ